MQLAQYFNDKVRYAYDIIPDKTKRLTRRFDRLKNTENPKVLTQVELALIQDLDCVLIDAPCSGTGTFGRLPVQKYHLSESHTEKMITVQRSLLNDTVNRVDFRWVYCVFYVFHIKKGESRSSAAIPRR